MGIILDIAVVAVIVVTVIIAVKKGFMTMVLELAAYAVSYFAAMFLSGFLAEFLYKTAFRESIINGLSKTISETAESLEAGVKAEAALNNLPFVFKNVIAAAGITPQSIEAKFHNASAQQSVSIATEVTDNFIGQYVQSFLGIIIFIVLFVLLLILAKIAAKAIGGAFKHVPVVGTANAVLGGILGFVKGLVIVVILCAAIKLISPLFAGGIPFFGNESVESTFIYKLFHNFLHF